MRYLSVLLIIFCLSLTASFGQVSNDKIGYVDQQYIFENLPEFKKLNEEMIIKSQQYDKILKEKYDEFDKGTL